MLNFRTISRRTSLFLIVAEVALLTAAPAFAGKQDFTVVNDTGFAITKLHVTPHAEDSWGEDILGKDTLDAGDSLDIQFHRSEDAKLWDLRIEDKSGTSFTWENINLIEIEEVTLHYKDGKAWATFK